MELRLTQSDLDAMPAALRRDLFNYLQAHCVPPSEAAADTGSALGRREMAALLREISFDRLGAKLRKLLPDLAYVEGAKPPNREKLAHALPAAERAQVGRYVATLNRLAARAAKRPDIQLCRYDRSGAAYRVHPATRQALRDLLPRLEHAGEHEEPLFE
jgi:hypothetical protein